MWTFSSAAQKRHWQYWVCLKTQHPNAATLHLLWKEEGGVQLSTRQGVPVASPLEGDFALLCCWHPAECPLHQKAHWTLLRFYTMRTCQSLLFPSLFPSPNCEFQTAASLPLHPQLMLDQHQELYSLYLRSGWNFNLEAMSFLAANYAVWGREKGSAPLVTINYPDHCPQHPSSSP